MREETRWDEEIVCLELVVNTEVSTAALIKSRKMIILSENAVLQEVIELQYFPINNLTKLARFMF